MLHKKPIFVLIVLATLVPEIFTGSTPITSLANPVLLFILIVSYGLTILLIREIAVRLRLNYGGIFLLGIGYGIYNEGLIAKTMLMLQDIPERSLNLPIDWLAHMGNVAGINVGFALTIAIWHGIASVLLPIYYVHYKNKGVATTPWLSKKLTVFLGIFIALFGTLFFFSEYRIQGTATIYFVFLLTTIVLTLCSLLFKRVTSVDAAWTSSERSYRPLFLGLSIGVFFYIILFGLGTLNLVLPYIAILILGTLTYIFILTKYSWTSAPAFIFFGIGFYMQVLLLPLFFSFHPVLILSALLGYVLLGMVFLKTKKIFPR